jgi:hypothetical protein
MAILKFRVYFEEDDTIYRDVAIKHTQSFKDLHEAILIAYDFDKIHQATFYRSNDNWDRGREISLTIYDKAYVAPPLIMEETKIATEIRDTDQKFIYVYDFNKNWTFNIALINVSKEESSKATYPFVTRKEGIGPPQYGTKSLLGSKFADIEEKYDLKEVSSIFSDDTEGEGANPAPSEDAEEVDF